MALIKNEEARELAALQKVEKLIERRERRERIHHILIAGLGALLAVSVITGHFGCLAKKRR